MHIGLVIVNASNVVQITGRIIGTINQGNELSSILLRVLRQYGKHVQRHEGFLLSTFVQPKSVFGYISQFGWKAVHLLEETRDFQSHPSS